MKKLLLFILLLALGSPVFGQMTDPFSVNSIYSVYISTGSTSCSVDGKALWECNLGWQQSAYNQTVYDLIGQKEETPPVQSPSTLVSGYMQPLAAGKFPGSLGPGSKTKQTYTGLTQAPKVVIIRSGHTVVITDHIIYNGIIIIEGGAKLQFNKESNNIGRLSMDIRSALILLPGALLEAVGPESNNNSEQASWLEIGGVMVKASTINAIPDPKSDGSSVWIDETYLCIMKFGSGSKCNITLPVELISFSARPISSQVELAWEAAKEWNFSHYVVEWSTDGSTFTPAGTISAKGTDHGKQVYSFRHSPGLAGTVYYRLITVDIDGTVEDKGTRVVRIGAEIFNAHAKNGRVHINYNGPVESQLVLFDTSGRVVRNAGLTTEGFETAGIAPGMYLLQISNSLERKVTRVVIQ